MVVSRGDSNPPTACMGQPTAPPTLRLTRPSNLIRSRARDPSSPNKGDRPPRASLREDTELLLLHLDVVGQHRACRQHQERVELRHRLVVHTGAPIRMPPCKRAVQIDDLLPMRVFVVARFFYNRIGFLVWAVLGFICESGDLHCP